MKGKGPRMSGKKYFHPHFSGRAARPSIPYIFLIFLIKGPLGWRGCLFQSRRYRRSRACSTITISPNPRQELHLNYRRHQWLFELKWNRGRSNRRNWRVVPYNEYTLTLL
ncbi:hypothetical protein L218DRAFT_252146 [Marasmius fiardii PR-910]|nr:hypothetical protein L218DRAFT_252146 [Marasmius fiardii PR-910]